MHTFGCTLENLIKKWEQKKTRHEYLYLLPRMGDKITKYRELVRSKKYDKLKYLGTTATYKNELIS
jgi:hypothetical protein